MTDIKAKKITFISNFVLLGIMLVLDGCYMFLGGTPIKAAASLLFVAIGVINAIYAYKRSVKDKYVFVMPIALTVAMAGDIAINFDFIAGAAVFALGHVAYVVAYFLTNKFAWKDLVCAAGIFIPSTLVMTLVPAFDYGGALMETVCVLYALILSLMVGKAVSDCLTKRSAFTVIVAAGSAWFYISDLALLINQFASLDHWGWFAMRVLCLATYYPAQFLLAFSIFVYAVGAACKHNGGSGMLHVEVSAKSNEQCGSDDKSLSGIETDGENN